MPKKAVGLFFLLAFIGAAIFIYFTFPRTKEQIPSSNNQRPFPSAPAPGPNGVPVPETVPHPNTPKVPPGPTLRVMAWAGGDEAQALEARADAFAKTTGRHVALTIDGDPATYRRDLRQALASGSPPDVCLVDARDFSGLDPARDLADAVPEPGAADRSLAGFTVAGRLKAAPAEFSVDVLFYNPIYFDQAGIGYPGRHWTWDILEADARALDSLKLKDGQGRPVYPVELPANFDFWNILCTEAGHPAMDLGVWHLSDVNTRESQMHALDFIHEIFQGLTVTAPLPKAGEPPGRLFAQQQAAILLGPSDLTATLPKFGYRFTLLPSDLRRASLARINGWAVTAPSSQPEAARDLANYLSEQPVHAGWTSVQKPADATSPDALCHEALAQALVPRIEPKSERMAQFLDQQINQLARNAQQNTDELFARIQTEFRSDLPPPAIADSPAGSPAPKPSPKMEPQLRGLQLPP